MENFKQKLRTDGFEYLTAPLGDIVKFEVYYYKGDRNRGVVVNIKSVKREQGEGYVSESFALFSGPTVHFYILPLPRKSDKKTLAVAEILDPLVPQIIELFKSGQNVIARELMQNAVNSKLMAAA